MTVLILGGTSEAVALDQQASVHQGRNAAVKKGLKEVAAEKAAEKDAESKRWSSPWRLPRRVDDS